MQEQGSPGAILALFFIFLAVGIYLLLYSRKRRALIKSFSQTRGLAYMEKDELGLEKGLNSFSGSMAGISTGAFTPRTRTSVRTGILRR